MDTVVSKSTSPIKLFDTFMIIMKNKAILQLMINYKEKDMEKSHLRNNESNPFGNFVLVCIKFLLNGKATAKTIEC